MTMSDENDARLGAEEMSHLRGRVLDGIRGSRRPVGRLIAGAAAVVAVAVVIGATWTAAASRPAVVASSPSPSATVSAPSTPEGLWTSREIDGAFMYFDPDGTYTGGDGCNGHSGTWAYEDERLSVIQLDGFRTLKACVDDENEREHVPVVRFPVRLQATGDTLRGTNTEGETVTLHRSPAVEVKGDTILAREESPNPIGDGALIETVLARTDSGVLGFGSTPVVFPAGTRLLEGGRGIEIDGVGTIRIGQSISLGGGPITPKSWGLPLPFGVEGFRAASVSR